MHKHLKYIKIKGVIKSRGEYAKSQKTDLHRPYEAVTIVDSDGDEVHFHTLSVSKRLDAKIQLNEPATFYVLRYRNEEYMQGVLYAMEKDGKKAFYPETAIEALTQMGLNSSFRITNAGLAFSGSMIGIGLPIMVFLIWAANLGFWTSGFIGIACAWVFAIWPMIKSKQRAGIPEMYEILKADGFDTTGNASSKY